MASEQLGLRGTLVGHSGWVTSIAASSEDDSVLVSGSRDNSLIVWHLVKEHDNYGFPRRALKGHSHFVQDCVVSSDGQYALSGSWDSTMRLWDLQTGATARRFIGHSKDVLSVAFSADNRQIVSGSRDKTIKLWNTLGECKFTITNQGHTEWVSCVRFSPSPSAPLIVSAGWDKKVKVWNLTTCKLKNDLIGHTGYVNTVTVSPDGSLCASGGRDGIAMLWDLNEGKHLYSLEAGDVIHALTFSPNRYWLCAAIGGGGSVTPASVKIWDLESKMVVSEIKLEKTTKGKKTTPPFCGSLCWSSNGSTLFTGWSDNLIRVYEVGYSSGLLSAASAENAGVVDEPLDE